MQTLLRAILAFAILGASSRVYAYDLYNEANCSPGRKWGTVNTVKVRFLQDSFTDYMADRGVSIYSAEYWAAYWPMMDDIYAVIDEYNAITGISLELEYAGLITGDDNLDPFSTDDFQNHSIIIGFSDGPNTSNLAWSVPHPDDVCTNTEAHVAFKKTYTWVFGTPATTDVDGKYFDGGYSFRSVLLHEVGHAVGLAHPPDEYAVMANGTKAWTRGPGEVPQVELLPDDLRGIVALYGNGGARNFDVSVTNTWFLPLGHPDNNANDALQTQNCKVSARASAYAPPEDEEVSCGVGATNDVCPGAYVQLRYTINNKSTETLDMVEQVWFSLDDDLEVNGAAMDAKSPDERNSTVNAESSATMGRVFRVPAGTPNGQYRVFARVVPYSTSGVSRWPDDEDKWNNSILVRSFIDVDTNACP